MSVTGLFRMPWKRDHVCVLHSLAKESQLLSCKEYSGKRPGWLLEMHCGQCRLFLLGFLFLDLTPQSYKIFIYLSPSHDHVPYAAPKQQVESRKIADSRYPLFQFTGNWADITSLLELIINC